jgi:hypothetical protein
MGTYQAEVITLDNRKVIRVTDGPRLVGYFRRIEDITDHGLAIDLADVEIIESNTRK